jgi:hypothetical protein
MKIDKYRLRLKPFDFDARKSEYSQQGHPFQPLVETDGLVFWVTPSISENQAVNHSNISLTHNNDEYWVYQSTGGRMINLTEIVFPCDTYEHARYAYAALRFFQSYTLMDYGKGQSGRPPAPMWLWGLGLWNKVPVLYQGYDFSINNQEVDLVGFATPDQFATFVAKGGSNDPSSSDNLNDAINAARNGGGEPNLFLPIKLNFGSVALKVQHTPKEWKTEFNLKDFKNGKLLKNGW